jgi:hypothetical protein
MSPLPRAAAALVTGRNGANFCLGFQWNVASWDTIPRILDPLSAWLDSRSVHWNLSALPSGMPVRRRSAVLKPLRARIEQRGDAVAAMGFSGASHPLLNIDELEREVSWGLKNPWGTGITDVLGIRPAILVPRIADCARPAAWKLYRDHGFRLIGVFPDAAEKAAGVGCISFMRIMVSTCTPGSPDVQRVRRLFSSWPEVLLQLDLSGVTDPDSVRALLEGPAGLFGGRTPVFSPLVQPTAELPAGPSGQPQRLDWTPFSHAGLHSALSQTAGISRKKRKKNEEYDALLNQMGSLADETKPAAAKGHDPRKQLRLVAHMLGDVTLAGSGFDVRLQGGRFSGITRQGRELMPLRPARSFVRTRGGLWQYRTVSSFSFESDHGTGLREELRIDGREDSIVSIEYSFRDDSPLLSIVLEIRYPDLPSGALLDEYAPLALPLRTLKKGETAAVEIAAPDGSTSSVTVSEKTGSVFAPGAHHRIRRGDGGWVVLHFASPGETAWGLPSFCVTRSRGARILECNPFGSSTPQAASSVSGRNASFSLRLGLEDA